MSAAPIERQADDPAQDLADDPRKRYETARATAARAGCTLHELAGGGYLLGRWQMARELPDLRAVHALLAQMTGQ